MSDAVDRIIEGLSPDQVLELNSRLDGLVETANEEKHKIAFLKIEKILDDSNLSIKDLMQVERRVKDLRKQKYTDGKGNFWSGRGKQPHWVTEAVNAGSDISSLKYENESVLPLNKRKTTE